MVQGYRSKLLKNKEWHRERNKYKPIRRFKFYDIDELMALTDKIMRSLDKEVKEDERTLEGNTNYT